MKHVTGFLLAVVCSSGLAWAQNEPAPKPGPGPKARAAIEFLDLSEAQLDRLRQIRKECRESLRPQAQQARELKKMVRAEMRKENPDPGLVGQYAVDGKSLRNEIQSARAGCKSETTAVLTPEQAARLEELEESLKHARVARQAAAMGLIDGPAGRRGGRRQSRNRRPRAL